MTRIGRAGTCLASATLFAVSSYAQGTNIVDGGYNAVPLNLSSGQAAPLQLDRSGNLEIDCMVGCVTASGGTISQGTPAAIANAWPVYLSVGGTAVTSSSGLPVTDTSNGAAISGATMPTGGSGRLGWLSAIENQLATGTITVAPGSGATFTVSDVNDGTASSAGQMSTGGVGLLGWLSSLAAKLAGTLNVAQVTSGAVTDGSVTIGTSSTAAVVAATGMRYRATLTNTSTVSGNTVWCRADGGAAAANVGVPLAANGGGYEWDFPLTGAKPAPAINCLAISAAAVVADEIVQ